MAAFSAGAAERFGLQACRDVESEKRNHVNVLILWRIGLLIPGGRAVVPLTDSRPSSKLRRFAHEIQPLLFAEQETLEGAVVCRPDELVKDKGGAARNFDVSVVNRVE